MKTLSIIGPGKVGKTLGRVFSQAGAVLVQDICGRTQSSANDAAAFIGAGRAIADLSQLSPADAYLIAVPDDAIGACSVALAASALPAGVLVFHCSGALTTEVLQAVRDAGARTASIHPVRSFADPQRVAATFAGTGCGIEGDVDAIAEIRALFETVGAQVFDIDAANKTLYHAAAVFASNYVVTLIDVAMKTYGAAGIANAGALALIGPLLCETADNALRLGPAAALTGPIARGDMASVARQQDALTATNPVAAALYAALAQATMSLASERRAPATGTSETASIVERKS